MNAEAVVALLLVLIIILALWVWWEFLGVSWKIEDLKQTMQMGDERLSRKIRTICASPEVIPNFNIIEDVCKIYNPDDSLLCMCDNELTFLDILCQISRKRLTGYYVIKDGIKYSIQYDGRVDTKDKPPLYTKYDDYAKELANF